MAGKTEQQLLLSVMGRIDKSLTSTLSSLNNTMDGLKVALNKVYNVSSRLEDQLGSLATKLTKAGQAANAQSSSMGQLAAETQAYSEAVRKLSAQNAERGIQQGSTAWNQQLSTLNKLERQLFKASRTMGTVGDAWYQSQDRFALLNNTMEHGVGSTNSYLKAIQKVGSYGTVYSNAVKRAAEQYGAGTAQFEAVAKGIQNVAASQAIAAQKSDQLGTAYKRLSSSRQVLAQAEQNAAGITKMTRDGLVAVTDSSAKMSTGMTAAKKGVLDYAKGLKELGAYGRQYQEAAVASAKDFGRNSAMYKALYTNIKAVGDEQLRASSRAKTLGTSYKGLATTAEVLNEATARHGKVQTEASKEMSKTVTASSQATGIMGTLHGAVTRVASAFKTMASYAIATAFITGIYKAAEAVVSYDQSLRNLQAISGATDEQMARMGGTLKEVASGSNKSIKEIAGGMVEIAQAGFSATETMQTIGAVTDLATGTMSDMGKSTELVTTIIRAFNKDASESGEVVDALAVAINKSKLDVDKLNTAYNYVGVAARQAGISFRDATASTMALANAGLKASTIGTGLRQVFDVISNGSSKFTKAIVHAGMSVDDFSLKQRSYGEVITNMNTLLDKGANFYDIFGTRAGNAAVQLARSSKQVQEFSVALMEVGAAQEMAQTQMQGLQAKIDLLQNKFQVMMATLSDNGLSSVFGGVLDTLNALMTGMTAFADSTVGNLVIKLTGLVVVLGLVTSAIKLLGVALSASTLAAIGSKLVILTGQFFGMAAATGTAATAMGVLAAIPVWGWIAAGVVALGGLTYALLDTSDSTAKTIKKQTELATSLSKQTTDLERYKQSIGSVKEGSLAWQNQTIRLLQAFPELASKIDIATASTQDYIRAINDLLTKKTAEHTATVKKAIDADIQMFTDAQKRLDNLNKGEPSGGMVGFALDPKVTADSSGMAAEREKALTDQNTAVQNAAEHYRELTRVETEAGRAAAQAFITSLPEAFAARVREAAAAATTFKEAMRDAENAQATINSGLNSVGISSLTAEYERLKKVAESGSEAERDAAKLRIGYIDDALLAYEKANEKMAVLVAENKQSASSAYAEERDNRIKAIDAIGKAVTESYKLQLQEQEAANAQALAGVEKTIATAQGEGALANKENNVKWQEQNRKNAEEILKIYTAMMNELRRIFGESFNLPIVQLAPSVQAATDGLTGATNKLTNADKNHAKALNSLSGGHSDLFKAERKRIANLKSIMELEEAQSRLAVAKGETSAEEAEIAVIERKIETAKEYLAVADQMRAKAKSETDIDSAEKEQNSANKELLNLYAQHIEAKKKIAKDGASADIELNKSKADLEIAGMNDSYVRYTEIERKKHDAKVAAVNAEIAEIQRQVNQEREGSIARKNLEADLNNKKAELAAEAVSYEKSLYDERKRYMDDYFAYGLMSETEYMNLLKQKYNEGQISALEYAKKRIEIEGSMYDQMKLGLAEWIAEQKTTGQQVVDLMKGTLDDIKSGLGDMIEGLIDGTKTAEQALADMLKNIGKRFIEFGINNMMSSLFKGVSGAFGLDTAGLLGMGGGDTAAASATTVNTTATTANTVALETLTATLSTASLTGGKDSAGSVVNAITGAVTTGGDTGGDALAGASDAMKASAYAMGTDVAQFAEESRSTFSDWSSETSNIFSSLASLLGSLFSSLTGGGGSGSGVGGLLGGLFSAIGSIFAKGGGFSSGGAQFFAHGAAFANGAYAFANGGVFNTPHVFKFAKGGAAALGVMGEKGPEAILPLKRDSQGNLGVSAQGAGGGQGAGAVNIVNVTDPKMVLDALGTVAGQKVVMNVIASNKRTLKRISG